MERSIRARPEGTIYVDPCTCPLRDVTYIVNRIAGARVYEAVDFEAAIQLAASGTLPLDRIVTNVIPLEQLEFGFREMERGGNVMKVLVECSGV